MQNYKVYSDSTTDLSPELIAQLGIQIIPLEFTIDGQTYLNQPDQSALGTQTFYSMLRQGKMATTSLINTDRYISIFEPELAAGNDLLYIAFSSGLTGSVACALSAADELNQKYPDRKLLVCDSLAASMGEGLLVYHAVQQKNNGLDIEALARWVEENRNNLCHWFTVDDLNHLHRGGRVSAAAAVLGGMLNIKPMLHVDDEGHLVAVSKVRGRRAALESLVAEMEKTVVDPKDQVVFISHGDSLEDCRWVEKEVKKRFGVKETHINYIGPVIGAHSGPGTIALFFMGTHK
jgi:DegV family protein with EDD domain